ITEWSERRQEQHYTTDRNSPLPYHTPSYSIEHPRRQSPVPDYRASHSPIPDYRPHHSPTPDYIRPSRISPKREVNITPTPPQRKKTSERQRQRVVEERTRYDNGFRSGRLDDSRDHRMEEPPPDYSPPSPPPMPTEEKANAEDTICT
ncbi:hypothetical protein NQ314_015328, partial [Rhamnusium bicolor]